MATANEISTAIASAEALGITYSQMESLIKRAIVSGLVEDDGRLVVSSGIDGVSWGFASIETAINALVKIRALAQLETNGGGAVAYAEFATG